ncbi:MAG: hypothetical protein NWF14_06200 [Candidatus Bathyarchaeota archaeon]|nr:hypothetical protein [Candidatus Bathyarchaeota archaeon]
MGKIIAELAKRVLGVWGGGFSENRNEVRSERTWIFATITVL